MVLRDASAQVKKGIFKESTHHLLEDLGDDLIALIRPKLNSLPPGDEKNDYLALLGDIEEFLDNVVTANKSASFDPPHKIGALGKMRKIYDPNKYEGSERGKTPLCADT